MDPETGPRTAHHHPCPRTKEVTTDPSLVQGPFDGAARLTEPQSQEALLNGRRTGAKATMREIQAVVTGPQPPLSGAFGGHCFVSSTPASHLRLSPPLPPAWLGAWASPG